MDENSATHRVLGSDDPFALYTELTQLVGGLAHELKNPLSTINLNLKLLSEDLGRYHDDGHRRLLLRLGRVQTEAERLRLILDEFLRYAGKCDLHLREVDLRELVGELRDFFLPQAEAGGVVLRVSTTPEPVCCNLDVNLVKQAILNLMINATQAMGDGGELLVNLTTQANHAVLEVIDTGPGIAPEALESIFRAYWSSKPDGSGLGLPTARRIAREHGGDLRAESEVGRGTRFLLTLPLARATDRHSPHEKITG
jgi:signal transduction histidine kinase